MSEDATNEQNLNEVFKTGYQLMLEIEQSTIPFHSRQYQVINKIKLTFFILTNFGHHKLFPSM